MTKHFTKTRIAPTPSGYLHLGNVLSFIITVGLARKYNAAILLRIDDLDRQRIRKEYIEDIFSTLRFFNIPWDEGPRNAAGFEQHFSQLHRLNLYNKALQHLQDNKLVFACQCSRSQLLSDAAAGGYAGNCLSKHLPLQPLGYNWRLITNNSRQINMRDLLTGNSSFTLPPDMSYFAVRKRDGYPAYQLASVIDDLHYGVDLVVRGEDLWNSTLAQLYLAQMLPDTTFTNTVFHHHLLFAVNGKKLSKSAGDTSVKSLREKGHTAAAILTMIATGIGCSERIEQWEDLFGWYGRMYHLAE